MSDRVLAALRRNLEQARQTGNTARAEGIELRIHLMTTPPPEPEELPEPPKTRRRRSRNAVEEPIVAVEPETEPETVEPTTDDTPEETD